MKLLYPITMEHLPTEVGDINNLEAWRCKHLLTYLAPAIMNASKISGGDAAMNLLLAAEGLATDYELSCRLRVALEIISEARKSDNFWNFTLTYYPYFEPLYTNCLTTHDVLLKWASS